jgi:hypothetical protein
MMDVRPKELDLLIGFANADITNSGTDPIKKKFTECLLQHPASHPDNRMEIARQLPNIMDDLQRHLRSRIDSIIENKMMLVEMPLWWVSGSVQFTLHPLENRFYERFQLRKVKHGNEIKVLQKTLDLWLIELMRDLGFKPKRICRCPRCDLYFHSPTEKERIYCSKRCGNAARQKKFRERGTEAFE